MVIIMCMVVIKELKNILFGNFVVMWNFLDNVKFYVENLLMEDDE